MNIGDVTAAQGNSAIQVSLQKSQSKQHEAVVEKLLESTATTSPANRETFGTGTRVNISA